MLEVCDPETLKESVKIDQVLQDSGSEFEEDFAIVKGKVKEKASKEKSKDRRQSSAIERDEEDHEDGNDSGSDFGLGMDDGSDEDVSDDENGDMIDDMSADEDMSGDDDLSEGDDVSDDDDMSNNGNGSEVDEISLSKKVPHQSQAASQSKRKSVSWGEDVKETPERIKKGKEKKFSLVNNVKKRQVDNDSEEDDYCESDESVSEDMEDTNEDKSNKSEPHKNPDGTWEDIYGRTRDKDGNVIDVSSNAYLLVLVGSAQFYSLYSFFQATPGKYIPPALRAKMQGHEDEKRKEILSRLRRQMKGLLNRLAENNMTSICNQVKINFLILFFKLKIIFVF